MAQSIRFPSPPSVGPRAAAATELSLWKRLNLICVAFDLSDERVQEVTQVPASILHDFRKGHCHTTAEEAERIRIFVREVEHLSSCALRHFKLEFAPLAAL